MPSHPVPSASSIATVGDRSRASSTVYDMADGNVILELLGAPFGVCGGMLSLHFDDDTDPMILATSGSAAGDSELATGALRHASDHGKARSNDGGSVCGLFETDHGEVDVVTIAFRSRESHSHIVSTAEQNQASRAE